MALLSAGLVALLLLNTALSEGAFVESDLKQRNAALADRKQQLEQRKAEMTSPQELAKRARDIGMVPGGPPAFLDRETGRVSGKPQVASGDALADAHEYSTEDGRARTRTSDEPPAAR